MPAFLTAARMPHPPGKSDKRCPAEAVKPENTKFYTDREKMF